ncbi:MAG TPA: hypothetical protein VMG38_24635 [Trebonia sp.]|nr:hypothetical protein [Trebonia sp.]
MSEGSSGRALTAPMTVLFTLPYRLMPYRRYQRTAPGSLPHVGRLGGVLKAAIAVEGGREREGAIVVAAP